MLTTDLLTMMAPYNPRKMSDHDMAALRRSLTTFGVVEPVVVNSRTNTVVGGHQRIRAAEAEGIAEMPVLEVDLDLTQEKLLNLALNRVHGEWDDDMLSTLLRELKTADADMDLSGFESVEIEGFLAVPAPPEDFPEKDESIATEHTCPKCGYAWSGQS